MNDHAIMAIATFIFGWWFLYLSLKISKDIISIIITRIMICALWITTGVALERWIH